MNEINLIGGFYKSKSLPFSAQDVVNWLPVPSKSEAARSPIKLRGLPGLKPLGATSVDALRLTGLAPDGVVGVSYSFSYGAAGGTPPYTFSLQSGAVPSGLSFSSGSITGTPTTAETQSYAVRVSDSTSQTESKPDDITINAPAGAWILFARPVGSAIADQYSIASPEPSGFGGAKRPAVVGGGGATINLSGHGGGWLFAAETGGGNPIRSNDLGVTWGTTAFLSAAKQQRIDVRGGRVIIARPSSTVYSDNYGAAQSETLPTGRSFQERYFYGSAQGMGGSSVEPDILETTDNFTNRAFISGSPTWGASRNLINLCAGTTHIVAAGSPNGDANRFSRVPIGTPLLAHTPFTVSAVSSSATWNLVSPSIAYGNDIFVMVTDQGQIVRSIDEGATWTVSSFTFPDPRSLAFGGGVFLICGLAGVIRTSTDGNTWTLVSSGNFGGDNITNAIFIP